MFPMSNRTVAPTLTYVAHMKQSGDGAFTVHADSEIQARTLALDKIGYMLKFDTPNSRFVLVDADDTDCVEHVIGACTSLEHALEQALNEIGWSITEMDLASDTLARGFSEVEE